MATNKTLNPTGVTIAIPAMADKPDASVFSNCIDKEADAINTLNSKLTTFTAIGATSGTSTNVEIQLPSNAMFTSSQPLFMIASFRGSTSNANEGYAILKIDNGVVYVTNKSGIQTLTNLSYNSTTKKLTFTSGTYVTFLVFGLAIS